MNDDIYAEWLVKRKDTWWTLPVKVGMIIAAMIAFLLMVKYSWGFLIMVAVGLAVFYFWRFLKVEYEYVFVTNELSVDRIYSQQIRKTAVTVQMHDVESVEETNVDQNRTRLADNNLKYEDFSSGEKDAKTYTMIYSANGASHLLICEPDEKLLKAMWRCSPSKVHIR